MTADKIAAIEQGIAAEVREDGISLSRDNALADLRAWQEIAERHREADDGSYCDNLCSNVPADIQWPCPDRQLADAAIDRMYELWGR